MIRSLLIASVAFLLPLAAAGQTKDPSLVFDAASLKPAAPTASGRIYGLKGGPGSTDPTTLTATNMTLLALLMEAYGMKSYQISSPSGIDIARFDIVARVPRDTTQEQLHAMIRNLLDERFKLSLHHQPKEVAVYALTVGKNGPKVKEAKLGQTPHASKNGMVPKNMAGLPQVTMVALQNGQRRSIFTAAPMSKLADMLAHWLGRPVLDETGLATKYDFTLDYTPEGGEPDPRATDGDSGPSAFAAVQEQLGLKLESRKSVVDFLVVDHFERIPTEN
jgi:uncharacterized protein (TIGR03435 family)